MLKINEKLLIKYDKFLVNNFIKFRLLKKLRNLKFFYALYNNFS